jgi:hypothetical protein
MVNAVTRGDAPAPSRSSVRGEIVDLRDRVTRMEMKTAHIEAALHRVERQLTDVDGKLDSLASSVAQGVGGLRVVVVFGQIVAAMVGYILAQLWQFHH